MPEKFRVEITRSAQRDVEEIWAYIAADSPSRASEFVSHLDNQLMTLERFPQRCPRIPENEILGTEYRHLIYGHYRTIFRISGKTILVLRVVHGARLLDATLFETRH